MKPPTVTVTNNRPAPMGRTHPDPGAGGVVTPCAAGWTASLVLRWRDASTGLTLSSASDPPQPVSGLMLYVSLNTVKTHCSAIYRKLASEIARLRSKPHATSTCSEPNRRDLTQVRSPDERGVLLPVPTMLLLPGRHLPLVVAQREISHEQSSAHDPVAIAQRDISHEPSSTHDHQATPANST